MIGIYDYTVVLTYLSLISAGLGIMVSLSGEGHPYGGLFFLLICGLCDAFDGKVARMKKDRTEQAKKYGIQIDSLSDLVAFGVLPACIGNAMICVSPKMQDITIFRSMDKTGWPLILLLYVIMMLYILNALIRLAYFNVTEEERQQTETGARKTYIGLPVTNSALIFPGVLVLHYVFPWDITIVYFIVMAITAILFVTKIKVPKAGFRGTMICVGIGVVEFVLLLGMWFNWWV